MTGTLKRIIASATMVGVGAVLVNFRPDQPWDVTSSRAFTHAHIGWIFIAAGALGVLGFTGIFRGGVLDARKDSLGDDRRVA